MSIEIYVDQDLRYKMNSSKEVQDLLINCMEYVREICDSYEEFPKKVQESTMSVPNPFIMGVQEPILCVQESTFHVQECPNAPIKEKSRFHHRAPIETIKNMNKQYTDALDLAGIERPCKRKMASTGQPCSHGCYKYRRCKYHLAVWKKRNPFLGHP